MTAAGKVVRWHKLPFGKFVAYEASRPMFQPFLIGAAYVSGLLAQESHSCLWFLEADALDMGDVSCSFVLYSISFVVCGILPTRGATRTFLLVAVVVLVSSCSDIRSLDARDLQRRTRRRVTSGSA